MAFVGTITKQPREEFSLDIDFASSLSDGEAISAAVVSIADLADRSLDLSGSLFSGSHSVDGSVVTTPLVVGGDSGHDYAVEVLITTDLGNKFEADVKLSVRET